MIEEHGKEIGVRELCEALGESRASFYRSRKPKQSAADRVSHRKLTKFEEERVLETLNSERFRDMAPGEIYATLLDEGIYLCSERSMYRILSRNKQNLQRRQSSPRLYTKPELLATAPNQLWSWDITKLKGPAKWTYFYLYKIIDVYSRFVVGWMVEYRETGALAKEFIDDTCAKQEILPNQLTLHADKGSSMTSRTVGQLLADLGVTKTHSRPHVSNDNPYSESAFKALKYRPGFPECFGSIEDARAFRRMFFEWYNNHHRHSGISMHTPVSVHYNEYQKIQVKRSIVLMDAYLKHPERFVKGASKPKPVPNEEWINKPEGKTQQVEMVTNI